MKPIKYLSRCYFFYSNTFAFIEDIENQINNAVFNHNCYSWIRVIWSFLATSEFFLTNIYFRMERVLTGAYV
jgi:hypothetical protein